MAWYFTEEDSFVYVVVNEKRKSLVDSVSPGKRTGCIEVGYI